MSKGFHRLPADEPWSNRHLHAIEGPMQAAIEASHFGEPIVAERPAPVPAADFEPGLPKLTRDQAKSSGFTGNQCNDCGSFQMVRNGTCEKCNSCGATTGCS